MKAGKAVRPYKGVVSRDGTRTNFSVQESTYDRVSQTWEQGQWYTLSVEGLNFPIEPKNPNGYKIVPNKITGVTLGEYNGKTSVTVWCDDVDILSKEGSTIVSGSKGTARKVGTSVAQVQAQAEVPTGFSKIEDEDLPF